MRPVPKSMFTVVRVGLIAVVLTACWLSTHYPIPSGPMTTLIPGWERHFMLEWTVEHEVALPAGNQRCHGSGWDRVVGAEPACRQDDGNQSHSYYAKKRLRHWCLR